MSTPSVIVSVRVPRELADRVTAEAGRCGTTVSDTIRAALEHHFGAGDPRVARAASDAASHLASLTHQLAAATRDTANVVRHIDGLRLANTEADRG